MKLIFLFILALHEFGDSVHGNLDLSWNPRLRHTRAEHFQSNRYPPRSVRSVGGRKAEKDEFPWTVALTTNYTTRLETCSGAMISPQHVLTAAHCVAVVNTTVCNSSIYTNRTKEENKGYQPLSTDMITVYTGISNFTPLNRDHHLGAIVVNMTIHPQYDPCNFTNDFALLQLSPNSTINGTPIAMPVINETIPEDVTFSGFGSNPEHPNEYPLEVVNLTVNWTITRVLNPGQFVTATFNRTICTGDSGGPLFKWNGTSNILLGIASASSGCHNHTTGGVGLSLFGDVTQNLDWVCQNSGVCPLQKTSTSY